MKCITVLYNSSMRLYNQKQICYSLGANRVAKMRCSASSPTLRKGLWSPEEDKKLITYIMKNGFKSCWSYVAKQAGMYDPLLLINADNLLFPFS